METLDDIQASGDLPRRLRLLVADRHSAEAAGLFHLLMRYAHKRVTNVSRSCGNALQSAEQEEVVAEVLLQLMQGSLAAFRGETVPELLGFVRTITDRTAWRHVRRKERERAALTGVGSELVESWTAMPPAPDRHLETVPDSPLSGADQDYLIELLRAGSKAELARRAGVSRAAVTQRVQRIRTRVAELAPQARMAHDVWMRQSARGVLEAQAVAYSHES